MARIEKHGRSLRLSHMFLRNVLQNTSHSCGPSPRHCRAATLPRCHAIPTHSETSHCKAQSSSLPENVSLRSLVRFLIQIHPRWYINQMPDLTNVWANVQRTLLRRSVTVKSQIHEISWIFGSNFLEQSLLIKEMPNMFTEVSEGMKLL